MRSFRWRGALLVFVAASFWPLHILTVNLFDVVRPERVVGLLALIWVAGIFLIWVLSSFGIELKAAENTSFVFVVFAMNGGPILREFGVLAYVIVIGCSVLAGWIFVRLGDHFTITALIWATAVALAVGPVLTLIGSWTSRGEESTVVDSERPTFDMSETPDIFLIVLDGYPGTIAADQDDLSSGRIDVISELRERGFQVPKSSWSSYWSTNLSIPSLLEMNYPVVENLPRSGKTSQDLQRIISGDNATVDVLKNNGYTTHMVESGWSLASCGPAVDNCVPSPLLDEATHLILRHTIAWDFFEHSPGPYALGTLAAFDWLSDHGPDLSHSTAPDFLFMHVVAPHPPLLLKADCMPELIYERTGGGFNLKGVPTEMRTAFLVEQIDCVDSLMVELADAVEPDDIVIFVSDHGTDRRYQADPDNVEWDRETTIERLNNFLAVRLPDRCSIGESVIAPNVLRHVLNCLTQAKIEEVPARMWINPMDELEPGVVGELMDMRPVSG